MDVFPDAKLVNLLASHSDHSPILLQCEPVRHNRRYNYSFKFENAWLQEEDLWEVVKRGWYSNENGEVMQCIRNCAAELSIRNKAQQKHKNFPIHMSTMEAARLVNDTASARSFIDAQREYKRILIRKEIFWKQRSKMHWLRHGDSNFTFFHRSATVRTKFNHIEMLLNEEGNVVHGQEDLCNIARTYFDKLFEDKRRVYDPVLKCIQPVISHGDNINLIALISKAEIYAALLHMHPDKSSGPDGFNPALY